MDKPAGNQISSSSTFLHSEALLLFFLICCVLSLAFSAFQATFPALILSILFLFIFTKGKATKFEPAGRDVAATQTTEATKEGETRHVKSRPAELLEYPSQGEDIKCNLELLSEHNVATSEGSVINEEELESDDDSLIEIAIPCNRYIGFTDETMSKSLANVQESVFSQELTAKCNEVIEEENLIEIDISIGSIKCPNLDIEV